MGNKARIILFLFFSTTLFFGCTPGDDVTFEEDSSSEIARDAAKTAVKAIDEAKMLQTKGTMRAAGRAINIYITDNYQPPASSSTSDLFKLLVESGHLNSSDRLVDGWGNPLTYKRTAAGFTLTSYGKDGEKGKGNSEWDADILWENSYFK